MKKNKETYESPITRKTQVNLESGFMSASVVDKEEDPGNDPVDAGNQEIEGNYDFSNDNPWS